MSDKTPALPGLATMVAAYNQMNHYGRTNGMELTVNEPGQSPVSYFCGVMPGDSEFRLWRTGTDPALP